MTEPPAAVLARFAAGLTVDTIPEAVRRRAGDLLLDALAAALGGVDDPGTRTVTAMAAALTGPGSSTVIGGGRLSPAGATLVNGHLISSVSLCDVHYPTWCHLTPEVVPAALGVGEREGVSGARLLTAVAAGCEVTARVGLGMNYPAFHARGWNTSGVTGVFGAAVAAGLLMGLDAGALTHAMGIAGAQAAGSDAHRGTPTVRFHQPRAALSGLMGAELAACGFTAMDDILTHPAGGLYYTHSDGGTPRRATDSLGERWELLDIWLTPWPLALLVRNVVDTVLDLVRAADLDPDKLGLLRIHLSSRAYELYGRMDFDAPNRAKTSPRYLAAAVVHDRGCGADHFTPERVADPRLRAFATGVVDVVEDKSLAERAVRVLARTSAGDEHTHFRPVAHGDAADPLTRAEIEEKFRAQAAAVLPSADVTAVLDFVREIEDQPTIQPLLDALGAGTRG